MYRKFNVTGIFFFFFFIVKLRKSGTWPYFSPAADRAVFSLTCNPCAVPMCPPLRVGPNESRPAGWRGERSSWWTIQRLAMCELGNGGMSGPPCQGRGSHVTEGGVVPKGHVELRGARVPLTCTPRAPARLCSSLKTSR